MKTRRLPAWLVRGLVLCLCTGAALFWWTVLQPAQARVEESRLRAAGPHAPGSKHAADRVRRSMRMPIETTFPDALGKLSRAAQDAGLSFDAGSYQVARLAQGRLVRYEIALPLHGSYPQLRSFLAGAAAALPTLVVDNIQLQRHKADDTALDARLRLAIMLEALP